MTDSLSRTLRWDMWITEMKPKRKLFLAFQENLLSGESQSAIEATGRRITANGVSDENKDVFNSSWGIDTERILSPIQMPSADVLMRP